MEQALNKVEGQWVQAFGDACADMEKVHRLPATTFVSVDSRYGSWFEKMIEKIDFSQFTVTGRPLEVRMVSAEHAERPIRYGEHAKRDTMLSLAVLFVDK